MPRDANSAKLRVLVTKPGASGSELSYGLGWVERTRQPGHCRIGGSVSRIADGDVFHGAFSARYYLLEGCRYAVRREILKAAVPIVLSKDFWILRIFQ